MYVREMCEGRTEKTRVTCWEPHSCWNSQDTGHYIHSNDKNNGHMIIAVIEMTNRDNALVLQGVSCCLLVLCLFKLWLLYRLHTAKFYINFN